MSFVEPVGQPRTSIVKPLLIGCGLFVLLGAGATIAFVAWAVSTPDGGVKRENEMQPYALEYLAKHKILNDTEKLVAYYDATLSMSGTEAAILTTERVIYHNEGR